MARRVDQVQHIGLAVLRRVIQPHGLCLDGNAALALDIHRVEHLLLHLTLAEAARLLDQAVGEGGFTVVDMRNDGEVADFGKLCHLTRHIALAHRPA